MAALSGFATSLRWRWIVTGVILSAALLILFIEIVDPLLQRPAVSAVVATVTLMLTGVIIGRWSTGETIVEAGIAGAITFVLIVAYLEAGAGRSVAGIVWVAGPFYAATFAMISGWVGERLQGTVPDAHDDRPLDWPWVFVSVVCGFLLEIYAFFLGGTLVGFTAGYLVAILLGSVFLTGCLVGFCSPGFTAIEPAIASIAMVLLSAGVAQLWLMGPLSLSDMIIGAAGGLVAGLLGGWVGELAQSGPRALALRRLVRGL